MPYTYVSKHSIIASAGTASHYEQLCFSRGMLGSSKSSDTVVYPLTFLSIGARDLEYLLHHPSKNYNSFLADKKNSPQSKKRKNS